MIKKVSIAIASPEEILKESYGEVVKAETINYRTYRPEPDGLFCERIFGPTKNYECYCGKYKKKRYKGVVCNTCGVKITNNKVRRERLGHISLVSPIIHIWFFRCFPKLANLLNWQTDEVEKVIYSEKYVLLDKGDLEDQLFFIKNFDFIGYRIYNKIRKIIKKKKPNQTPIIKTGAQAFEKIFKIINIKQLKIDLNEENKILRSTFKKKNIKYQLKTLSDFIKGKKSYKNIILKIIPVIPPDIRPLVQLDNGKFATSDLNELYRRLIIRNNRLKKFLTIRVPQIIIRNERRLLQESVDSLFDNSKKIIPLKTENNRVIKSLSDTLKGKLGRFRFNLLGKRVDYSGRSVIISGPKLKLYECGLPREMLIELFRPYLLKTIIEIGKKNGENKNLKEAQEIIIKNKIQTYKLLNKLIYKYPILLNRAPTLHKLGIQAFYPKINNVKAIELHPLVCAGFNADFDGDQMAVHIPLSKKAILEAKILLFPSHNILNPANGNAILVPSQDMLLGLYYLTNEVKKKNRNIILFSSSKEVQIAYNNNIVDIHSKILLRLKKKIISTTVGRVLFNLLLPKKVGYYNKIITKTSLSKIIKKILLKTNNYETIKFLDKIKEIGFGISFKAGISFNLEDLIIPDIKKNILKKAIKKNKIINNKSEDNNIRYKKNINFWSLINNKITKEIINYLKNSQNGLNPIYMMLNSGARSSIEQIRQITGMRGLMAKPQKNIDEGKNIIENPIYSNFLEGLSNFEYFISTHGARKGLADTALKTADAGYLTRRLVDVAQNVIIKEDDCKTLLGIYVTPLIINNKIVVKLEKRCLGRISLQNIYDKKKRKYILKKDELINEKIAKLIKKSNLHKIKVRSPLTCQAKNGICRKCYGINLSTGSLVQKGVAVGILAAQSIGEPGTQLTLRTFHIGGIAGNESESNKITESNKILSNYDGKIKYRNIKYIKKKNYKIVVSKDAKIIISNFNGDQIIRINIPYGCKLFLKDKQNIKKYDIIYKWNPDYYPIISEKNCKVILKNFYKEINYIKTTKQTGKEEIIIKRNIHNNLIPSMILINKKNKKLKLKKYLFPTCSKILVQNLNRVKQGKLIAKIPRKFYKSTDITGGLPRVSELLETRKPFNSSFISEIGGLIHFGRIKRKKQDIFIIYKKGRKKKYKINIEKKILVNENDKVKAGTQLSEGEIAINEILTIKGIQALQKYLINEIQEIYILEGVKIADKHFEIIIRQMLKKVKIIKSGDTDLLVGDIIDKEILEKENNKIKNYNIIISNGKSKKYLIGEKIENKTLKKRKYKQYLKTRETFPAIGQTILQGITKSALQNQSFLSAASFQETTKILSESALKRQKDYLTGVKENVILGNKIPVGTGYKEKD
ncbi:DNA-directed RNA polymerase subunit beta' [Candidatus Karelsulcia muelleri]|uniref:DNA-directed RNA polymerase subunit beta' n=1 Tax=Candidatus Karelsulcia muelleri TaxID=336810 RepID=UPI001FF1E89F|nr:DNA-directed RNA polymerase subunit beta' [Candidatus Karelsulcia muelleri]UOQ38165.1 DNA-directed RNA polymerase subunit beta' [Candidatus Karelsulcia muelleri]